MRKATYWIVLTHTPTGLSKQICMPCEVCPACLAVPGPLIAATSLLGEGPRPIAKPGPCPKLALLGRAWPSVSISRVCSCSLGECRHRCSYGCKADWQPFADPFLLYWCARHWCDLVVGVGRNAQQRTKGGNPVQETTDMATKHEEWMAARQVAPPHEAKAARLAARALIHEEAVPHR